MNKNIKILVENVFDELYDMIPDELEEIGNQISEDIINQEFKKCFGAKNIKIKVNNTCLVIYKSNNTVYPISFSVKAKFNKFIKLCKEYYITTILNPIYINYNEYIEKNNIYDFKGLICDSKVVSGYIEFANCIFGKNSEIELNNCHMQNCQIYSHNIQLFYYTKDNLANILNILKNIAKNLKVLIVETFENSNTYTFNLPKAEIINCNITDKSTKRSIVPSNIISINIDFSICKNLELYIDPNLLTAFNWNCIDLNYIDNMKITTLSYLLNPVIINKNYKIFPNNLGNILFSKEDINMLQQAKTIVNYK